AGKLLERVATREIIHYLVGVDLFEIMSSGRGQAAAKLKENIQKQADFLKLGVQIVFVGLQDIHPPLKVARKFEDVNSAGQEVEAELHAARGYAEKVRAQSRADAEAKIREAEAYATNRVAIERARAGQFGNFVMAYRASPTIFTLKAYLETLARSGTNSHK